MYSLLFLPLFLHPLFLPLSSLSSLSSSPSSSPSFLPPSSFHNKSVYLQLGMQKMISKSETSVLHRHINVFVDEKKLELPEVEGVVVLNIQR